MPKSQVPSEPVIHMDDCDMVKPDGYQFESLGLVRDGSKSMDNKNVYENGYHVTEACVLTEGKHPVSIFSEIHSPKEKNSHPSMMSLFNALNFYITLCMAFLTHLSMSPETNALKVFAIKTATLVKDKVYFCYYFQFCLKIVI